MSRQVDGVFYPIEAGEALVAFRRVQADGTYADAAHNEAYLGTTQQAAASGEMVTIKLKGCAAGTVKVTAAGAITSGNEVYAANDGKVQASLVGGTAIGRAMEAAANDGDVIEAFLYDLTAERPLSIITLTAGEALAAGRLVKLSTGKVVYSDQTDNGDAIGTTVNAASAEDDDVAIKLLGEAGGTHNVSNATGNIAVGDALYSEDDGKVQTTLSSGVVLGYAIEARTGAGEFEAVLHGRRPANASA